MSSNKTYKEKIRERFLNKKRQASISKSPVHKTVFTPTQVLNKDYLEEETEVATCLNRRASNDEENQLIKKQTELEIAFFTSFIYDPEFEGSLKSGEGEDEPNDSVSIKSEENHPESATHTHLASSYFQIDDENVVEEFVPTKLIFDDEELFCVVDENIKEPLEIDGRERETRSIQDEGLYIPDVPKCSTKNKILLFNRLVKFSSVEWIDEFGEIVNFQNYIGKKIKNPTKFERILPTFIPPTDLSKNITPFVLENKILKIHIIELKFDKHPFFSKEEAIAKKIQNLYEEYVYRKTHNIIDIIESKLLVLRDLVIKIENDEHNVDIQSYKIFKNEISKLRTQLYREEKFNRNLLRKILEHWKKLKHIRVDQDFNTTTVKIIIKKQDFKDLDEDTAFWNKRFEMELNEIYNEQMDNYNEEKLKLRTLINKVGDEDNNDGEDGNNKNSDDGENVKVINVPKLLKKPDIEELRDKLLETFSSSLRHPGEPLITIQMGSVVKTTDVTPKEVQRRKIIENAKYYFNLVFDNVKVSSAKEIILNLDFKISLEATFTIKLTTIIPKKIELELYEQNKLKILNKICSIFLPVPDCNELFNELPFNDFEFSSIKKLSNTQAMSGKIKLKIGWLHYTVDSQIFRDDKDLQRCSSSIVKYINTKHCHEFEHNLKAWFNNLLLDPVDPKNKTFINNLVVSTKITEKTTKNHDYFTFNEDLLAFCSEKEFNENIRFNLLEARNAHELKHKNIKLIPQFSREIEMPEEKCIIEETLGLDPIDMQRHRGKKYLKQVYDIISHHIKLISKDNEDCKILIGDEIPTFGSLSLALFEMFGPKRPLKPVRKSQPSRASYRLNDIQLFNIVVNVERAFGVPTRNDEQLISYRKSSTISSIPPSFKTINVRPFVSINYKEKTVRTSTADGSSPTWNEQLSISINNKLHQLKGCLNIQLFDEYVEDIIDDDPARTTDIYQRISCKWIGELRIPISTIYSNQRIEGIFEINTPQILLGYTKSTISSTDHSTIMFGNLPEICGATHVSLFISVEPICEIEKLNMSVLECTELDQIKEHVAFWMEQIKIEIPARPQYPFVTLLNGKRICVTRLIGKISIPFEIDENTEFLIRRYVSLIPIVQTLDYCIDLDGVWLTNNQIINFTCASPKDLGILLTCYYISMGVKAWAAFGYGLLCGNTCFVLIKEYMEFFIIDPMTGKKYNSRDTYCPLTSVNCLINDVNYWANIQRENRVYMTQFDVNKSRDWRSLFNRRVEAPLELEHDMNYEYINSLSTAELQNVIELKLYKKISTWRTHRKTLWNRYMNENLLEILSEMEREIYFDNNLEMFSEKLTTLFSSFKVNGFPINMPYLSLSAVVERVKSTGIHLISDENAEFSLAVKIFSYPRNIFSLWIFLVSLVPKV